MANANYPRGLVAARRAAGGTYNDALRAYSAPASYATALFIGDPVVKTGNSDTDGTSQINLATAGGRVTGVVAGFEDVPSMLLGYGAASTLRRVLVDDDPETLFEVQSNGQFAAANVGKNADLVAGAGSTTTRTSGWQLNQASVATTSTLQVKIVEAQKRADNDLTSANAKVLVKLNNHTELAGQAGV